MASAPPMLQLDRVCFRYPGARADTLADVSLELERGKTLCVLGGSGGGKTTLFKIMVGVLRPTSGRVVIDGEDTAGMSDRELDRVRLKFGVMFQRGALLNSLTVAENVALPLRHHSKLDKRTIDTAVKIKLHQVGLLDAAYKGVHEISGGMLVRAAIARAMALDPSLLFYDEPSAGLDPITTTRLDSLINELKSSLKVTNVVVTHVLESVARIADRVLMLSRGRVLFDGTYGDFAASEHPVIRQFRHGDVAGPDAGAMSETTFYRWLN